MTFVYGKISDEIWNIKLVENALFIVSSKTIKIQSISDLIDRRLRCGSLSCQIILFNVHHEITSGPVVCAYHHISTNSLDGRLRRDSQRQKIRRSAILFECFFSFFSMSLHTHNAAQLMTSLI